MHSLFWMDAYGFFNTQVSSTQISVIYFSKSKFAWDRFSWQGLKKQKFRNSVDRSRAGVCFDDFERGTNVKLSYVMLSAIRNKYILQGVSKLYQIRNEKIYVQYLKSRTSEVPYLFCLCF